MSRATLEAAIAPGTTILLDSSIVLAYLNGGEAVTPAAEIVIDDMVASGRNRGVVSAITVTEVLLHPFRAGERAVGIAEGFLRHFANLVVADVSYDIAREAARIRAATNLHTPDSLIIATAVIEEIPTLAANDAEWAAAIAAEAPQLSLCHLDAHVPV